VDEIREGNEGVVEVALSMKILSITEVAVISYFILCESSSY